MRASKIQSPKEPTMFNRKVLCVILFPLVLAACGSSPSYEGLAPAEVSKLQTMGVSAEDAQEYREMGFTSGTIQSWYDQGITIQQNIIVWHDARFSATDAGAWHAAGFVPKDAYKWRGEKFNASDAKLWRDAGHSMRDASKMRKKGKTP
jgi:hypothetical protein